MAFRWLQIPETHQERAELLKRLMPCDECMSRGLAGHFGDCDVYRMETNSGIRDPLICAACRDNCEEQSVEMHGPLSADEVLEYRSVMLCERTGRVFFTNGLIHKMARVPVHDDAAWIKGEHMEFSDALAVLHGCDISRRLGRIPFEETLGEAKRIHAEIPDHDTRFGKVLRGRDTVMAYW